MNGLLSKIDNISFVLHTYKPICLAISESHLSHIYKAANFSVEDYSLFQVNRSNGVGRGVALFVHYSVNPQLVVLPCKTVDSICVQVHVGLLTFRIACFYIPPVGSAYLTTAYSRDVCTNLAFCARSPVIIVGDFNCPDVQWSTLPLAPRSSAASRLHKCAVTCGLAQHVNFPTHTRGSMLDCVFSFGNLVSSVQNVGLFAPTCDHYMLGISLSVRFSAAAPMFRLVPDFLRADYIKIEDYMRQIDWKFMFDGCCGNPNDMYIVFLRVLNYTIDKFVPCKRLYLTPKPTRVLLSADARALLVRKRQLWSYCKQHRFDARAWIRYRMLCRQFRRAAYASNVRAEMAVARAGNNKAFF